jgi:Tol biopolymer transport system component
MSGRIDDDSSEHDLSWFDWTGAEDFSADGKLVLFDESGDGGGPNWTAYLRQVSDGRTLRLGEGHALALAPDGRSAVTMNLANRGSLSIVPVGEGQPRELSGGGIQYQWARYLPDGQHLLVAGSPLGGNLHLYLQAVNGGKPQPLTPEIYLRTVVISPDGKWIAGADQDSRLVVCALEGGERRLISTPRAILPVAWSSDGRSVLVRDLGAVPATLYRVDLSSGRSAEWKTIGPANPSGVQTIVRLLYTPNEKSYVYSYQRNLSQLYLADGWK